MFGIERIKITSPWNDWRIKLSSDHQPIADEIYRHIFKNCLNLELAPGENSIVTSMDSAIARYDWKEGIDIILHTTNGQRMTLQEKFLTFNKTTITYEEKKTSGKPGVWYYCTAQYYFVGYTQQYWDWRKRKVYDFPIIDFQDWILVDNAAIHRSDARREIDWKFNDNKDDGRRATFRFTDFNSIPTSCIVARK